MKGKFVQGNNRRMRRRTRHLWYLGGMAFLLFSVIALIGISYDTPSKTAPQIPAPPETFSAIDTGEILPGTQKNANMADTENPWYFTLVNKWNPIPENYELNLVELAGGERIDQRIYEPLSQMLEAAMESNWNQLPIVVSGYRTKERQQELYDEKVAQYRRQGYSENRAKTMAEQWVAVPGYSEHQLGFAVDINGATYDLYLWLQENSYKYGFIFRYPGNKTEITGTAEEVWHYRYVGVEAASEIYERGICLEEYLEEQDRE